MNRQNSNLRTAHSGVPLLPLKIPGEYFDKSRIIDHDLYMINHVSDPYLASESLLKKKNALLKSELARMNKIIEETGRLG